jgi:hypothetical protein
MCGPSTPTPPARSSSTCARIDRANISPTLRPMPSSRTSMTFSSSSSSTTANTVLSVTGPSRLSLSRRRHDDHRDRPTSSQPGSSHSGASRRPTGISSPTAASLARDSTTVPSWPWLHRPVSPGYIKIIVRLGCSSDLAQPRAHPG